MEFFQMFYEPFDFHAVTAQHVPVSPVLEFFQGPGVLRILFHHQVLPFHQGVEILPALFFLIPGKIRVLREQGKDILLIKLVPELYILLIKGPHDAAVPVCIVRIQVAHLRDLPEQGIRDDHTFFLSAEKGAAADAATLLSFQFHQFILSCPQPDLFSVFQSRSPVYPGIAV